MRCNTCTKCVKSVSRKMDKCSTICFINKSCDNNTIDRTLNLTDDKENVLSDEINERQNDLVATLQTSVNKTILNLETRHNHSWLH